MTIAEELRADLLAYAKANGMTMPATPQTERTKDAIALASLTASANVLIEPARYSDPALAITSEKALKQ